MLKSYNRKCKVLLRKTESKFMKIKKEQFVETSFYDIIYDGRPQLQKKTKFIQNGPILVDLKGQGRNISKKQ
jgi:hypothetical protein